MSARLPSLNCVAFFLFVCFVCFCLFPVYDCAYLSEDLCLFEMKAFCLWGALGSFPYSDINKYILGHRRDIVDIETYQPFYVAWVVSLFLETDPLQLLPLHQLTYASAQVLNRFHLKG